MSGTSRDGAAPPRYRGLDPRVAGEGIERRLSRRRSGEHKRRAPVLNGWDHRVARSLPRDIVSPPEAPGCESLARTTGVRGHSGVGSGGADSARFDGRTVMSSGT